MHVSPHGPRLVTRLVWPCSEASGKCTFPSCHGVEAGAREIRQFSKQSPVIGIATSMGEHGKCRLQVEPMTRLTEVSFALHTRPRISTWLIPKLSPAASGPTRAHKRLANRRICTQRATGRGRRPLCCLRSRSLEASPLPEDFLARITVWRHDDSVATNRWGRWAQCDMCEMHRTMSQRVSDARDEEREQAKATGRQRTPGPFS